MPPMIRAIATTTKPSKNFNAWTSNELKFCCRTWCWQNVTTFCWNASTHQHINRHPFSTGHGIRCITPPSNIWWLSSCDPKAPAIHWPNHYTLWCNNSSNGRSPETRRLDLWFSLWCDGQSDLAIANILAPLICINLLIHSALPTSRLFRNGRFQILGTCLCRCIYLAIQRYWIYWNNSG